MIRKDFNFLGRHILFWSWNNEIRKGAKGKTGFGIIIETKDQNVTGTQNKTAQPTTTKDKEQ